MKEEPTVIKVEGPGATVKTQTVEYRIVYKTLQGPPGPPGPKGDRGDILTNGQENPSNAQLWESTNW